MSKGLKGVIGGALVAALLLLTPKSFAGADRKVVAQQLINGSAVLTLPSSSGALMANPMSTLGDVIYGGASGASTRLAGNTTATKMFLSQTGDGGNSAAPVWSVVSKSDVGLSNVSNDAQVKMSEYTAKGDILVGTGAGAYSALGVGTNGYVIMADSTGGGGTIGVKWAAIPSVGPTVTGSTGTPQAITAVGGIAFTGSAYDNIWFVAGDGGAIDISASPQIAAGSAVGQRLTIVGTHDTNTVKLEDGTGLSLNGAAILANHSVIRLMWDGSVWVEESRQ